MDLKERGFGLTDGDLDQDRATHGWVVMRKRDVALNPEDLQRMEQGEPREESAMRHHIGQLQRETIGLRTQVLEDVEVKASLQEQLRQSEERAAGLKAELEGGERLSRQVKRLTRQLDSVTSSRSWRLTRPLRSTGGLLRRLRGRGGSRSGPGP
jgi:hypothetical protein